MKDLDQLKRYAIDVEKVIQYTQETQSRPTLVFEATKNTDSQLANAGYQALTDEGFIHHDAIKALHGV